MYFPSGKTDLKERQKEHFHGFTFSRLLSMTVAPVAASWASVSVLLFTAFFWTFKTISVAFITWGMNWTTRSDRDRLARDSGRLLTFWSGNLSIPADRIMWGSHWTWGWHGRNGFIRWTNDNIPPCSSFFCFFLMLALWWRRFWSKLSWWSCHGLIAIDSIEGFGVWSKVNRMERRSDWWNWGQWLCSG